MMIEDEDDVSAVDVVDDDNSHTAACSVKSWTFPTTSSSADDTVEASTSTYADRFSVLTCRLKILSMGDSWNNWSDTRRTNNTVVLTTVRAYGEGCLVLRLHALLLLLPFAPPSLPSSFWILSAII
jgi:hypothetical protein